MADRSVYLDNNATTPLHPEVKKKIVDSMQLYGNPSSMHLLGRKSHQRIEKAREVIADFINAKPTEIIFVGCGTEANNTVLNTVVCKDNKCSKISSDRLEIITSAIEHPAVLSTTTCLQHRGFPIHLIPVDVFGKLDLEKLKKTISNKTALVSIMLANNEIGTIQDIKQIARITHENGSFMHTDAVQGLGKIPIDVKDLDVDFLSLSGHKVYGPKGIGVLYVKEGTPLCPLIYGGHQEKGRRAGTENSLGILGLGKAIEMLDIEMEETLAIIRNLREKLKIGIQNIIPNIRFNGHPHDCVPNTLNVSFEGAEGEAILLYLDLEGIAVSTGSACASGSLDPSHVLLATGIGPELAHGSIRFSLGRENTEQDIDYVLDRLPKVIDKVRNMSSVYQGV